MEFLIISPLQKELSFLTQSFRFQGFLEEIQSLGRLSVHRFPELGVTVAYGGHGKAQLLAYKCLHYGKELSIIDERDTTRMCHKCKRKQDMPLWQRTYRCKHENCGLVMDRDENSAVNIYQRFVAGPPPHTLL